MNPTDFNAANLQTAAFKVDHAAEIQTLVEFEQVRLVWARPLSTSAMGAAVSVLAAYLLWPYAASQSILVGWTAAVSLTYVLRAIAALRFTQQPPSAAQMNRKWNRLLVLSAGATGILWAALVLLPMRGDPVTTVAIVSFIIGGITAAGIVTVGSHRMAALCFTMPCLAMLSAHLIFARHMYALGIVALMYALVAINSINFSSKNLSTNVRLRLQSEKQRARVVLSERQLRSQQAINQLISRTQQRFIDSTGPLSELMPAVLDDLLKLTHSEYGFIGQVFHDESGAPYLKTHALTNVAWDEHTKRLFDQAASDGMEFRNLKTLFGAAILDGAAVIANDAAKDSRAGGVPLGHPPLNTFLGAPIKRAGEIVGLVGLANRAEGYDQSVLEQLDPILSMCAQLIDAKRNEAARADAEEHVARMHAQLSAFIEHTPVAVAMFDQSLALLAYSERWRHDFNILETDLVGKGLYSILPDIPALWRESFDRALQGSIEGDEADPYIRGDGSVRWFRWIARPWLQSESAIGGIILFCEDITDAKRAADALHSRDQLLSKLSARIPGMLFQLRVQPYANTQSLLYVSAGAMPLYGKTPEELADDPDFIFRVCHPDDRLLLDSAADTALRSGELMRLEFRVQLPDRDQQWFYIEAALERLADASVIWHGYIRDISDRKHDDAAARELAERLRLAARAHQLGIWDCVLATSKLTFDDRLYEIYGVTREQAPNPWHLWTERVHPEDAERIVRERGELSAAAERGAQLFLTEFRLCLPTGVRRIRSRGTVEHDAEGRPIRLVGVNWDMGAESDFAGTPLRTFTVLSYRQIGDRTDAVAHS